MTGLLTRIASAASGLKTGFLLAAIMLFALLVRVVAVLYHPVVQGDEIVYLGLAESFIKGHGMEDLRGVTTTIFFPLLPLFIAGVSVVVRNYILSGEIVVAAFGTLLLIPVFLMTRSMTNESTALKAAALASVMPLLVSYSSRVYTEIVYSFFLLMAIFFAWNMFARFRPVCGLLVGVSLGLAYLANPSAVAYLMVFLIIAVFLTVRRAEWRPGAITIAVMFAAFAVLAAPYVIFLHNQLDRWTYSGKSASSNISATSHNLKLVTPDWEKEVYSLTADGHGVLDLQGLNDAPDPVSYFARHPVQGMKLFLKNTYAFYADELPRAMPLWLLPLLSLGIFAHERFRRWPLKVGFLLIMMAPALFILALDYRSRFFVPFAALSLVWMAQGWTEVEKWFAENLFADPGRQAWKVVARLVIAVFILLPALVFSAATVFKQGNPEHYRTAGEQLKQQAGPGKRIMDRNYIGTYYADGTAVILPYADYNRTTLYARYNQVDYMILSRDDIENWRPALKVLLNSDLQHPDWKLVETAYPGTAYEVFVFKLSQPVEKVESFTQN